MFVDVAVPAPLAGALTYALPPGLDRAVEPGSRVLVELGRRRVAGVVLERHLRAPAAGVRVKDVLEIVEPEPVVPAELLRFLRELSDYYLAPIGEVIRVAMPAIDRADAARLAKQGLDDAVDGNVAGGKRVRFVEVTDVVEEAGTVRGQALSILHYLRANGITQISRLSGTWKNARPAVKKLVERGLVRVEERETARDPFFRDAVTRDAEPTPTEAQASAINALADAIRAGSPKAFLLHGITGSGKTEVYLRAIAVARAQGKGALMLVPEIALTPQLVGRFRARFGDGLAVLHSGLSQRDRHSMWRALRAGDVQVAIGARSALFAPVPKLGLVIVDEEHDGSFKQEEGVRYHARDMAMLRAHRASAVCVLGSATPSLETEHLARSGKIDRLTLPARARESATLPDVVTIDMRRTGPGPLGDKRLSLPLHRKIMEALGRGEQTILFLNRRGFAPSVVCEACGVIATCRLCSVALTFHHRGARLRCHYCDAEEAFTETCRSCGNP